MGLKIVFIFSILLLTTKCENTSNTTKEEDLQSLAQLFSELKKLSESEICTDVTKWKFTAYGSKACGGSQGFIAYPTTIDEVSFLKLVENYTILEKNFNQKWNIVSDCAFVQEPTAVICENGKPKLVYN